MVTYASYLMSRTSIFYCNRKYEWDWSFVSNTLGWERETLDLLLNPWRPSKGQHFCKQLTRLNLITAQLGCNMCKKRT